MGLWGGSLSCQLVMGVVGEVMGVVVEGMIAIVNLNYHGSMTLRSVRISYYQSSQSF